MESKKNEKYDVRNYQTRNFLIGLIISLGAVFYGFTVKQYDKTDKPKVTILKGGDDTEVVDPTEKKKNTDPPPAVVTPQIKLVDDNVKVDPVDLPDEPEPDEPLPEPTPSGGGDGGGGGGGNNDDSGEEEIFMDVSDPAGFPGGDEKLYEFLGENLKYPDEANDNSVEGKVLIQFVVEKDGSISNVKILTPKERQLGYGCEEEATRVVKMMPSWTPAKQNNKTVRSYFQLPIIFQAPE